LLKVGIADIAQVINPNFARKKSVGSQFAQEAEEFNSLPQAWVFLRILSVGDQIENLFLLLGAAIEIRFSIAVAAGIVEPHQPAAERHLVILVLAGQQTDEL